MGKHSARRRRAPLAVATGAAAVLAAGGFATTLADGSLEVPRVTAAPDSATPTTTVEPVSTRTSERGDGLNRASRSFTRTAPPSTGPAPEDQAGSPSTTPSAPASPSTSASPGAARTRSPGPSATPSTSLTPSTSPTAPSTPTTPTTPSATPSPTPTGSILEVVPGIIGGLLP